MFLLQPKQQSIQKPQRSHSIVKTLLSSSWYTFLALLLPFLLINGVIIVAQEDEKSSTSHKPRLIILTDIGGNDPDDEQSLVRLLMYANEFNIEGLIAGADVNESGSAIYPELITEIVNEYAKVYDNLLQHSADYPTAESLHAVVKEGQPIASLRTDVFNSIGPDKDTEASNWIIDVVDSSDHAPVNIAAWGGTADLAQALWRVREDRTPEEVAAFVDNIRVYSIADQDSTAVWIRENFPDLFYIRNLAPNNEDKFTSVFRGMYLGGNTSLVSPDWVEENLHSEHGPLAGRYPRAAALTEGTKEGDTPSWFYFLDNGLHHPDYPEWGGWGGRFGQVTGNYYEDVADTVGDVTSRRATIWRWREAFQNDFEARADWTVMSYEEANHNPVAVVAGDLERDLQPGTTVTLDATGSTDPDNDNLTYHWMYYPEAGTYQGELEILEADSAEASFIVPDAMTPQAIHVVLTVTDDGEPALTAYQRVIITIEPEQIEATDLDNAESGLTGTYFADVNLETAVFSRQDATIDFDWEREAPTSELPEDRFSIRWEGWVVPAYDETYTFYTTSDDGVRLYIDGQEVTSDWSDHEARESSGTIDLEAGTPYALRLEYYDVFGGAQIKLEWSSSSQERQVIPASHLYSIVEADIE